MQAAAGTFASGTSTGDISIVVGFTPKVMFFWTNATTNGANAANAIFDFGVQTGTGASATACSNITGSAENGVGTTDTYRGWSTDAVYALNGTTTGTSVQGRITSFGSTCTFNINTAPASSVDIHWLALAGADMEVAQGTISVPGTDTTTDATGTFTNAPNVAIFWSHQRNQISGSHDSNMAVDLGIATKSPAGNCAFIGGSDDGAAATNSWRFFTNDLIFAGFTTTGVLTEIATINSWLSNGIRLSWDVDGTHSGNDVFFLLMNVPNAALISQSISNTGSTESVTGAGFTPGVCIALSHGTSESTSIAVGNAMQDTNHCMFGYAVDNGGGSITQGSTWYEDVDAADPTDAGRAQSATKIMDHLTGGASPASDGSLTLTAFTNGGANFTKVAPAAAFFTSFLFLETTAVSTRLPDPIRFKPKFNQIENFYLMNSKGNASIRGKQRLGMFDKNIKR